MLCECWVLRNGDDQSLICHLPIILKKFCLGYKNKQVCFVLSLICAIFAYYKMLRL